jgi:AcrR family transcriptional regulator
MRAATTSTVTALNGSVAGEKSARERILVTAAALFAKNGYHATGIAEVCTAVGLSKGSLYYHFSGKEALLYEICLVQVQRVNSQAAGIVAQDLPAPDRLRALGRALLENISTHLEDWTVFFREFGALSDDLRGEILAARDTYEQLWLRVLRDGKRDGTLREVSPLVVKGMLGMFNYSYLWFRPGGKLTPQQMADVFFGVLMDGLRTTGR